ncbi:ABC transporter permease [Streptomyces sp. SM10]|uniref:ABC transporter permease n=1 Tax=Streptomyces sp. SM10 TaxID=565556 RepID=UPI0021561FBD|nr:ABC transporter permease [Streptomyces sp. SM10]
MMGTAVLFGTVAVTFAVGMGASLGEVTKARAHDAADVTVAVPLPEIGPAGPVPEERPAADPAKIAAAIEANSGTGKYYSAGTVRATVSGVTGTTAVNAFTGDAYWGGYTMVSGRWFDQPGEAAVPTGFLAATGIEIGDTVTLNGLGEPVTVRIVGEVLDPRYDGMQVFTDAANLTPTHADLTDISHYRGHVRYGRG